MYPSRGASAYGQQQPYASQSAYSQTLGTAYSGSTVGGPDGGSQLSMASRHSSMLSGPQEPDMTGYGRGHPTAGAHYGGQYSSVYGSTGLSSGQQIPGMSAKGAGPSALEGRSVYGSAMPESPKFTSGDYVSSSSHGYGQNSNQLFSDKVSDYPSIVRRQYAERQSAYVGRDLQNASTGRYGDSVGFGHQHQPDVYDRMNQASLLRQEQVLKAQSLQSASLDGGSRQSDYLAARGPSIHHPAQDHTSYGGRIDADPRSLSMLSGSTYGGQHAPSILGAAPQRNADDLMYSQNSSNPGYGVSLPPGRDYAAGKGLHGASFESDYPGDSLLRGGHSRLDERKDDRGSYARELERREEERRREYLREREKDREREKERERERERKRERERERERILELREKERVRERERERERGLEIRRERTPSRISRDRGERHGSSVTKDVRPVRRDSPRRETLHRRLSPVKEKRREYLCKVYSSSLVDVERDYLSLDKRYPRLFISPECSKVVVNWPRENLSLPMNTPISFEHDFVEEDTGAEQKPSPAIPSVDEPFKSESGTTVWNAKMIMMSGLSQNTLEELSAEKSYDDRIPHFCNILRFAVLKKDHAFMAIGGPWDAVDGGDPSFDDSSLIQTVIRHAKDVTQLELKNCKHWSRFLEIHYARIGKDGLSSHQEVTVLYVPDLLDCLPSLEAWRDQWLAHKKAIAERERKSSLKKEKPGKKEAGLKDKEIDSPKEAKGYENSEKKVESVSPGQAVDINKKQKDDDELKGNAEDKEAGENVKSKKYDGAKMGEEGNNVEKKALGESADIQTAGSGKPGKKKIVRKIVKQKVANKKEGLEDSAKPSDKLEKKNVRAKSANIEIPGQLDEPSTNTGGVKTFVRKKVVRKVPAVKTVQKENEGMQPEMKINEGPECSEDKQNGKSNVSSGAVVQEATVITAAKKPVIRRVPKRKVADAKANEGIADSRKENDKDGKKLVQAGNESEVLGDQSVDADSHMSVVKSEKKIVLKMASKSGTPEKQDDLGNSRKTGSKASKEDKEVDEKSDSVSKINNADKKKASQKDNHTGKKEKSKVEEKKDKGGKNESRSKLNKEVKEKKQHEEPPRRPGLFLQVKGTKDSKIRSLSLSLDSLLDYTDKDIEESTFEVSLFAESLYEMLQYQMGCRLLAFLQKLRIKFVRERNQRKRQRDATSKETDKNSPVKRVKTEVATAEAESTKIKNQDATYLDGKDILKEEDTSVIGVENVKPENGMENVKPENDTVDEDPEEDPEEDDEMLDSSPQNDLLIEKNPAGGNTDADMDSEKVAENAKDKEGETAKETSESKPVPGSESKEKIEKMEKNKGEMVVAFDKELLQAFRFFDRNRVGYIRVEDMRLIIHNLGKFLSHREVKELVQSALLLSNTGRDDRILYDKLVRMPDI